MSRNCDGHGWMFINVEGEDGTSEKVGEIETRVSLISGRDERER